MLADYLKSRGDIPSAVISSTFAASFIEWYGVLYGILLPLILVRVWEQLDDIDREFDREADSVRIMYQDLSYLPEKSQEIAVEIASLLRHYVRHVVRKYPYEVKESIEEKVRRSRQSENNVHDEESTNTATPQTPLEINERFRALVQKLTNSNLMRKIRGILGGMKNSGNETKEFEHARKVGDDILLQIRKKFAVLIRPDVMKSKDTEFIVQELFHRLNEIVDIRGDRIGFASQRLFQTLSIVALIASIIFLVPFYIVSFTDHTSWLDILLILGLTLLVVFMYMIIEDFDEPFGGTWKIDNESWLSVRQEIVCEERQHQLAHRRAGNTSLSKPVKVVGTKEASSTKRQRNGKQSRAKSTRKPPPSSGSSSRKPVRRKSSE